MKRALIIIMAAVLTTGCYLSEMSNTTHTDKGKVVINKILPDGAELPEGGFTILFNGKSYTSTSETTTLNDVIEPGVYTAYIYSNNSEMTIDHDIDAWGGGTIISSKDIDTSNSVRSLTEDLYFGTETITVLADKIIYSDVNLMQVTRDISFNFKIAEGNIDNIAKIDASLTGIAGLWECVSDTPMGYAVNIIPVLERTESLTTKSTEVVKDHITGTVKVLGIQGDDQVLTINLTLTDGSNQTEMINVSDQLSDSNNDKEEVIILSDEIETPIESSIDGTIDDWTENLGEDQKAN